MKTILSLVILLSLFLSTNLDHDLAQELVDAAIQEHGSELLTNATVKFDFRGKAHTVFRNAWRFDYSRTYKNDAGNSIVERFNNQGVIVTVDGRPVSITEKQRGIVLEALNSVVYFAYLPLKLNDPAVNKSYEGMGEIDGKKYHRVKVSFGQEGGGIDYQDIFMFWFDPESKRMSYLAYNYNTSNSGARFRTPFNVRRIGGVLFADYMNHKAEYEQPLEGFESTKLRSSDNLLSTIELENLTVTLSN